MDDDLEGKQNQLLSTKPAASNLQVSRYMKNE
jgi:hypothetical protein